MTSAAIMSVCDTVRKTGDSVVYRVLWISPDRSSGYWIPVNSAGNVPERFVPSDVDGFLKDGSYEYCRDEWTPVLTEDEISLKWKKHRDDSYQLIRDIAAKEPEIYERSARGRLVADVVARHPDDSSLPRVYKQLGRYWKRGKIPNALLPDYGNVGKHRDIYKEGAKRGGRPKQEGANGKKLTPDDVRHFSEAVRGYYLTPEKITFKASYTMMLRESYSTRKEDGRLELLPPDDLPSFYQYQNWYRRNKDIFQEIRKRDGQRTLDLKGRAITGKTETHLYGPGDAAQIDATCADIYLVSRTDRTAIVGRPAMYFVMDASTRMVTGMHITLENASWQSEALAIRNCLTDKKDYCKRYGIEIKEEDWPCRHLMSRLIGDRGELESSRADVLAKELGIQVVNTPPYRGDLKGIIEQHFNLINVDMAGLPGNVLPDFTERGGKDYRLDAMLDLHQFTAIIIRCVLQYNRYHYMADYEKDMQMRRLGVRPIPLELWNYGLHYQSGGTRTLSSAAVDAALLPRAQASITAKGIYFHQLYYTCEKAEQENWFSRAKIRGTEKITISYDPTTLDRILCYEGTDGEPLECHLAEHESMYRGLSDAEHEKVLQADLKERKAYEHVELNEKVNLDDFIEKTVSQARKMQQDAKSEKSKTERISDIRKNRSRELEEELQWQTQQDLKERGLDDRSAGIIPQEQFPEEEEQISSDEIVNRRITEQLKKLFPDMQSPGQE